MDDLGAYSHLTALIIIPKFTPSSVSYKLESCNNFISAAFNIMTIKVNTHSMFLIPTGILIMTTASRLFRVTRIIVSYLITSWSDKSKLTQRIFTAVYIVSVQVYGMTSTPVISPGSLMVKRSVVYTIETLVFVINLITSWSTKSKLIQPIIATINCVTI